MAYPHIVIITGLSGSGKTSAVKAFEDVGYFCVDNLPIQLIPTFVQLCDRSDETLSRAAIVIDIREKEFLPQFPHIYQTLKKRNIHLTILFFEANDETIRRRFSETRRPHPLNQEKKHLAQAIAAERALLAPLRALADMVVDTSDRNVHALRQYLIEQFSSNGRGLELQILIMSFGFKHGLPPNMDLLFDVRFLPNPHFVAELRHLTGKHPQVAAYINQSPDTQETLRRLQDLLEFLLPHYRREGRSYLTIGIGCTGGRHRSVMVAEVLRRFLRRKGYKVKVQHRDWKKLDIY